MCGNGYHRIALQLHRDRALQYRHRHHQLVRPAEPLEDALDVREGARDDPHALPGEKKLAGAHDPPRPRRGPYSIDLGGVDLRQTIAEPYDSHNARHP